MASILASRPLPAGWKVEEGGRSMACPQGVQRLLDGTCEESAGAKQKRRYQLRFRSKRDECEGCPLQNNCRPGHQHHHRKEVLFSVTQPQRMLVQEWLSRQAAATAPKRIFVVHNIVKEKKVANNAYEPGIYKPPGPFIPISPRFQPAASRRLLKELVQSISLTVVVKPPPPLPPPHPLPTPQAGLHSRLTWSERQARRTYHGVAIVEVSSIVSKDVPKRYAKVLGG